jgi:hypothetical protein
MVTTNKSHHLKIQIREPGEQFPLFAPGTEGAADQTQNPGFGGKPETVTPVKPRVVAPRLQRRLKPEQQTGIGLTTHCKASST